MGWEDNLGVENVSIQSLASREWTDEFGALASVSHPATDLDPNLVGLKITGSKKNEGLCQP